MKLWARAGDCREGYGHAQGCAPWRAERLIAGYFVVLRRLPHSRRRKFSRSHGRLMQWA
jgi:hypothetical protein